MMKIERLCAKDYDEWISFLNYVFSIQNKRKMDFEAELPKMCKRDDLNMGKHFAIRENGRICSLVGVYPLPMEVAGQKLLFSTVGNIATHPDYTGKGYMNTLMQRAMEELNVIGADASRLCGLRHRYSRYGYEPCGREYNFEINGHTTKSCFPSLEESLIFKEVTSNDTQMLSYISNSHRQKMVYVDRGENEELYNTFRAWGNHLYVAYIDPKTPVGYLCVSQDGGNITEIYGESREIQKRILFEWQAKLGKVISFSILPHQNQELREYLSVAEDVSITVPSRFKIINIAKVVDAYMKLKANNIQHFFEGELVIGIKNYGNIRLYAKDNKVGCENTQKDFEVGFDYKTSVRVLFGPDFSDIMEIKNEFLRFWLPLPFGWSTLDRT